MSDRLPDCAACRPIAEAAVANGKFGWVMCSSCQTKSDLESAAQDTIESAKDEAWRTAQGLAPEGDRLVASAIMMAAELDVMRRILSSQLHGGEAMYWRFVKQELKR